MTGKHTVLICYYFPFFFLLLRQKFINSLLNHPYTYRLILFCLNCLRVNCKLLEASIFIVVQSLSHVQLFLTPWTAARQTSLSFTISPSLLKFIYIESVMPSNHLILCHPFSSCLLSFPASGSFQMSQFFTSGGQSIGTLASASVLPMNIQG